MQVLVCVKRVPATGGRISLTADERAIDTTFLGFTVSPHEECAVEEAVRIVEGAGGSSVVMTLGPAAAEEQLRDAMAVGIDRAILLETDEAWGPVATADAIAEAIRADGTAFDLLLLGNDAADTGDHQVGVRVAHALGLPCLTGVDSLEIGEGSATARRKGPRGVEVYEVRLPAVFTVKEGINLPRLASVPGRIKAKKKEIVRVPTAWRADATELVRLLLPPEESGNVQVLGTGPDAAPAVVDVLAQTGVLDR
jgi:electron transfer flavoprotein beta subunit